MTDEQRWIPVTERMPKHFADVRIRLDRGHGYEEVEAYHSDTLNCWAVGICLHHESNVTHWQPLPQENIAQADQIAPEIRALLDATGRCPSESTGTMYVNPYPPAVQ